MIKQFFNMVAGQKKGLKPSEGLAFYITGGKAYITGLGTCTDSDIVIPTTYNGYPVIGLSGAGVFASSSITSIYFPEGFQRFSNEGVKNCSNLTTIYVPSTINSIAVNCFYNCPLLKNVYFNGTPDEYLNLPNVNRMPSSINTLRYFDGSLVTDLVVDTATTIPVNMFYGSSTLTTAYLGNSVTTINGDAFAYCSNLVTVDIGTGITYIGGETFYNCYALTSLTIRATTPPTFGSLMFGYGSRPNMKIYVPAESLEAYKTAANLSQYANQIYAISE